MALNVDMLAPAAALVLWSLAVLAWITVSAFWETL
jgi:hypothetical protein